MQTDVKGAAVFKNATPNRGGPRALIPGEEATAGAVTTK